jgi:ABC-2 type transport system permease protein
VGRPSAAFVLQLLAPLLLFCMTFASVAGERETGTWPLCLAQGASVRALVLGKALGSLAALCVWLMPALALGIVAALASGVLTLSWDSAARGLLLAIAYALYLAFCALLGVAVSSRHRRPQAALLSLLALWIGLWVVVPRLVTAGAATLHPTPSRAQLELDIARAVRSLGDSHDPNHAHFAALRAATLQKFGVARIEDLPINYGGVVMAESEQLSTAVFNDFHTRLYAAYRTQDEQALRWGLYTPLLALRAISMAAAGTDSSHLAHFDAQAEAHRYQFIQRLNELHTTKIRWESDRTQRVDSSEWSQFARFAPLPPPLEVALSSAAPAGLALLAWVVLAGLGALRLANRSVAS